MWPIRGFCRDGNGTMHGNQIPHCEHKNEVPFLIKNLDFVGAEARRGGGYTLEVLHRKLKGPFFLS